jgi:putative transposase
MVQSSMWPSIKCQRATLTPRYYLNKLMNTRDNKPNFEGAYFHVYNRGVNRNLIFLDDQDYSNLLYRARVLAGAIPPPPRTKKGCLRLQALPKGALTIFCYCLMPNHFHFLIRQNCVNGLKMFMQRLCTSYSRYFNKKYERVGHVFQDIFKVKHVLEDAYLTQLVGYIHLNPDDPFAWKYSSLSTYLGLSQDSLVNTAFFMEMHGLTPQTYQDFLRTKYDAEILSAADLLFDE